MISLISKKSAFYEKSTYCNCAKINSARKYEFGQCAKINAAKINRDKIGGARKKMGLRYIYQVYKLCKFNFSIYKQEKLIFKLLTLVVSFISINLGAKVAATENLNIQYNLSNSNLRNSKTSIIRSNAKSP